MRFRDRSDAGRRVATYLAPFVDPVAVTVLALPRGGVPVAFEVALRLKVPMDVFLVRKLGVPGRPELAMGAVAAGGVRVLSQDLIRDLDVPPEVVEQVAARERDELERREQMFRAGRPALAVAGRTVVLVDDGLATGSSMEAAIVALGQLKPTAIVVAVPVGARDTCHRLRRMVERVVCLRTPEPFDAVGVWYDDFDQTTDEQVRELLARARGERTA